MPSYLGAEVSAAVAASATGPAEPLSLVVVCAWCGRPMGRGAASAHRRIVSHGICRPCSDDVLFSDSPELLLRR